MKVVFFTHPDFLGSQSMPRFAKMLSDGMQRRGHSVEIWQPSPFFYTLSKNRSLNKWLGYIDQFVIFPLQVNKRLRNCDEETLFVFTDHALGPWVPLVKERAHIIHCHDFLAQLAALGKIKKSPVGVSGRIYQKFIRKGYTKGSNFISVSNKTRQDLKQFLVITPKLNEVVYNGLNRPFTNLNPAKARLLFGQQTGLDLTQGYILHIGGNQWYKNRLGVIDIYNAWRKASNVRLPLLLVGKSATAELQKRKESSDYRDDIFFLTDVMDGQIQLAYSGARMLLFPSLAEGFGWPIAEAMASGCPVITTDMAPMTEVAADAAFLIPVMPDTAKEAAVWATETAKVVDKIVSLSQTSLEQVVNRGLINSKRFDADAALDKIEKNYEMILTNYRDTNIGH